MKSQTLQFATCKQETRNKKQETSKKTKSRWTTLLLLLFVLTTMQALAQPPSCSYTVHNPGPCPIDVQVTYYDNNNNMCLPIQNQTIPAYSNAVFNCGNCTPTLSNIVVDLVAINSINIGATVDINNQNTQGTNSSGCGSLNYTMSWLFNETFIGH